MMATYPQQQRRSPVMPGIFLLIVMAILAWIVVNQIPMPTAYTGVDTYITGPGLPVIKENPIHPEKNHSLSDVTRVRECIKKNGAMMKWREDNHGTIRLHLLCQDKPNGEWLDMIIQKIHGKYEEITSFPTGHTEFENVRQWLLRKAATPFKKFP